jgi:tetratricopeptide (TPR) repeat protein
MYLHGSKWSMTRRRKRRTRPWLILFLLAAIGGAVYVNQVVVPTTGPLFVPSPTPTRNPQSYISDAEAAFNGGKLKEAISNYKLAIQVTGPDPSLYVALARVEVYAGLYQDAKADAENALLKNPNNPTAMAVRGWALTFLGDYLPAEASFKDAIQLDPNNAWAHAFYAELLAKQIGTNTAPLGVADKAASESNTAKNLAPNSLETLRARGIVLQATGNPEQAIQEFLAAAKINDYIEDIHINLGLNYRSLASPDYSKAIDEFTRAGNLNPNDPWPYAYISSTYATVGEYAKAIQYAQQAISVDPNNTDSAYWWGNLGVLYYRTEDYEKAIESLKLAVSGGTASNGSQVKGLPLDYGRVASYYADYGLSLARTNQCSLAIQISQTMLQGVKDDPDSVYNANTIIDICKQNVTGTFTPTPGNSKALQAQGTQTP